MLLPLDQRQKAPSRSAQLAGQLSLTGTQHRLSILQLLVAICECNAQSNFLSGDQGASMLCNSQLAGQLSLIGTQQSSASCSSWLQPAVAKQGIKFFLQAPGANVHGEVSDPELAGKMSK